MGSPSREDLRAVGDHSAFELEDGKLYHQGPSFRHECRMYSVTGCTPDGEARFEFVENGEGEIEGLIYYDSAYDKGWRIERIDP